MDDGSPGAEFLGQLSSFIWGPFLLIPLLAGTGVFLTWRLRGLQWRKGCRKPTGWHR